MRKLMNAELDRKTIAEFHAAKKIPLIFILDNVRSALNVGSIFRTADAFLLEQIILCGYTATPPHREVLKTALGATETVSWQHQTEIQTSIQELKQKGWKVYAVEQTDNSIPLDQFKIDPHERLALILGNEVEGVQQRVIADCDGSIEIPQQGMKHSLNIAVCAGIVAWEINKQHIN